MEVRTVEHKDIERTVAPEEVVSVNFIEAIINKDNETGKYGGRVLTRFPPEPNGYLHIGHAKSICLNFGIGKQYNGLTNLRFDDTNPTKEDIEYVNSIMEDVKWLGFEWDGEVRYASDYFGEMYEYAKKLISLGKAYVDDQTAEEIKQTRGDFSTPGINSPYRDRSVEENLKLFEEMKDGKYDDGEKVFKRPTTAIGRDVFSCHPPKVEPIVRGIIESFRNGERDNVAVWLEKVGRPFYVNYMAVRDQNNNYLGTLELVQDMQFAKEHFARIK